jgi:predicted TIM-barrel fold metal-dependent hydrolase
MPDGGEGWAFEGGAWLRPLGLEAAAGRSPSEIREHGLSYSEIGDGMHDGAERLADMDRDSIDTAVVFPTFGVDVRHIEDPALHIACVLAYNDGVREWAAAADSGRLIPMAMVPAVGIDAATAELQRVAKTGCKGIVFSGWPSGTGKPQREEEPFWALCAEAGIVVNLVRGGPVGADRTPSAPNPYIGAGGSRVRAVDVPPEVAMAEIGAIKNINLSWMVLSGVLQQFPGLRLALIDCGAGWLPTCGELFDWYYRYEQFVAFAQLKDKPGEYIRRQVKATVQGEPHAIATRRDIGVETLLWSSNYPNSTSSWPDSARAIDDLLAGIPDDERTLITEGNCAALYGIPVGRPVASGT